MAFRCVFLLQLEIEMLTMTRGALRRLCDKLYLKAETQQVDRILAQFSRRYFDNNPKGVYGSAGADSTSSICPLSY